MGTTRIKVIDLSSEKQQVKTARKHAEKLSGLSKIKRTPKEPVSSLPSTPTVPSESSKITPEVIAKETTKTLSPKSKSRHHQGKNYQAVQKLLDKNKVYPVQEAIDLLYKTSYTKFDPTVELHLNVQDKNIRGSVNLPHPIATQKQKRYLVFGENHPTLKDKQIIWGNDETIALIESGKLKPGRNFDQVFSTPKFMPKLTKVAKILGPRGLMPNPKNGTIAENVTKILEKDQETGLAYQTDPTAPVVHTKLGKLSLKPQQLEENLKAIILAIGPAKIKRAVIKSTMSPGIKVDISSLFTGLTSPPRF